METLEVIAKRRSVKKYKSDPVPKELLEKIALADERTKKYVEGKQIIKTIVVPGRIINIVIK